MNITITAALPWQSIHAEKKKPEPIHVDTEQEINKCLSCTKAECDDCLAEFDRRYKGRPRKVTAEELRIFLLANDIKAACEHFGCNRSTIWRRLREID